MIDIVILLGAFVVLCMIGMPVAYALGLAAILGALWIDVPLEAVMIQISSGVNSFSLLAIPFFVLAGAIMAEGGMARAAGQPRAHLRRRRSAAAWRWSTSSPRPSSAASPGSSVADTASIGSVLIPQMVKQGYPKVFATNVTICGSVQAVLIPPSHNAVIYSLAAGGTISVASLFLAGVLPGLLFGACVMGLCVILSYRRGYPKGEPVTLRQAGEDRRRRDLGAGHRGHHPRRHPDAASSRRPSRRRSRACTRSSSRCSSTATTAGASCRCCCTASPRWWRW